MKSSRSEQLFKQAKKFFPGGVNSPVRAFGAVGGVPPFVKRGQGCHLWDEDDRQFIDYVGSWGPLILGHAHPEVVETVKDAAEMGLSFGAPTEKESLLAEKIQELMPSMEKMRFVSSGTEACMSAIRVARGFTGRELVVKFSGNYHGHSDGLLVKAGSGVATFCLPDSPGVVSGIAEKTIVGPYNDCDALKEIFAKHGSQIAAVIFEPLVGNSGFIRPRPEFVELIRNGASECGALVICDEVMTGFRANLGGMQKVLNIKPDLTTLGKVVGGGMPLAVYGGRADIMSQVAPEGPIYQAGTLSGNPIATAAGLKTLELISKPGVFEKLTENTKKLASGIGEIAKEFDIPTQADSEGGMFGVYFSSTPVSSFEDACKTKIERYVSFFNEMLENGVYLAPSAYEVGFVSTAHSDEIIDETLKIARKAFEKMTTTN